MANKIVRNVLLIYLGIIAVAAICAFRFTTHPLVWILFFIGILPVILGIARGIVMAVRANK